MLKRLPETYNELICAKSSYKLANYFRVTEDQINYIYDFLSQHDYNQIRTTNDLISLYKQDMLVESFPAEPLNNSFDSISISNSDFHVVSHYTDNSSYSDSGSSSNNNNNNNNNNNG